MRQWGQHAGCMVMREAEANALQTWWHELLQGGGAAETVAIATGRLASGWHGTGAGELAGWSGHWVPSTASPTRHISPRRSLVAPTDTLPLHRCTTCATLTSPAPTTAR